MKVFAIKANQDNWIYVHPYQSGQCWIVDPSDALLTMQILEKQRLVPTHILVTHHPADHTSGISALKKNYDSIVLSPDIARIQDSDLPIKDGFSLRLEKWNITVLATPGHTSTSVCYFCTHPVETDVLYSGDTLFACGCGRLFECPAETMAHSLQRLMTLPEETCVFPGHDYVEENLRFALSVEPDHEELKQMLHSVRLQKTFKPTTLAEEKKCNPFLRLEQPTVQQASGFKKSVEVFAELRRRKDFF